MTDQDMYSRSAGLAVSPHVNVLDFENMKLMSTSAIDWMVDEILYQAKLVCRIGSEAR